MQVDGPGLVVVKGLLGYVVRLLFDHDRSLFGEGDDGDGERNDGDRRADEREIEASVLADLGRLGLVLVGLDVYDVVLLEVEGRGAEDIFRGEIEYLDGPFAVCLAGNDDFVAHAVNGHVAGHGQCVEDRDPVAVDLEAAGMGDLSDDGELHVGELYVYRGVVDVAALDDLVGNQPGEFVAGEALALDGPDDGHQDASVLIDGSGLERLDIRKRAGSVG